MGQLFLLRLTVRIINASQGDGAASEMLRRHVLYHQDTARHRLGTQRALLHVNAVLRLEMMAESSPTYKVLRAQRTTAH